MMRRMRILVVDDMPELLQAYERSLARLGYEISAARDAQEALTLMAERHKTGVLARLPDLVVTDYEMPGMKGDAFCRELKRLYASNFPVVLVSGHAAVHSIGRDCGVNVITHCKPVSTQDLHESIELLLAQSGKTALVRLEEEEARRIIR